MTPKQQAQLVRLDEHQQWLDKAPGAEPYWDMLPNWEGMNLTNKNFNRAYIAHGNFRDADLRGATFNRATLVSCDFSGATWDANTFSGAHISRSCAFQDIPLP